MDLISVVIPCYNGGATIGKTVASVKAQTWPNLEIIVVNDGSTDPMTLRVLTELTDVTVVSQSNLGLPAARNAGFRFARGKYVLPLDADDWIEPETILTLIRAMESASHEGFAYVDSKLEGEATGLLQKHYNYFEQLFLNQLPYCLLIPKRVWNEVGGYDETMRNGYEDWEFNIRLGRHGYHGLRVAQPLLHYRVSSSGMLISKSNRIHGRLWKEIQTRHRPLYQITHLNRLWRTWRSKPSRFPLTLYFMWYGLHRLLPPPVFSILFKKLRERNHDRRKN